MTDLEIDKEILQSLLDELALLKNTKAEIAKPDKKYTRLVRYVGNDYNGSFTIGLTFNGTLEEKLADMARLKDVLPKMNYRKTGNDYIQHGYSWVRNPVLDAVNRWIDSIKK
jgi:hypothetical protein